MSRPPFFSLCPRADLCALLMLGSVFLLSGCGVDEADESIDTVSHAARNTSKTLTIRVLDEGLVPAGWQYREIAKRTWLPGCYLYDVLQGSGWFPATFYKDVEPDVSFDGQTYTYITGNRSWHAGYCGAEMDTVGNYVFLDVLDDSQALVASGTFNVIGLGDSQHAQVHCRIQDQPDWDVNLVLCNDALVGPGNTFVVDLTIEH